jgi:hypothetical protein
MAYGNPSFGRSTVRFGVGSGVPPDVLVLLAVVFVTFSLQFFGATAWLVELLRLTPRVWLTGFVWQLLSYPLAGVGPASPWILLELFILFWFARDVHWRLGRRAFWRLLLWACGLGGVVAVAIDLALRLMGAVAPASLTILQGQRMLLAVALAAFAVLFRDAQILLFFVVPVQARWLLLIELLVAFVAFLATHDLAGLLGIYTGIAVVWLLLGHGGLRRGGREMWLRLQQTVARRRMARLRRRRGFHVVVEDERRDPWLH